MTKIIKLGRGKGKTKEAIKIAAEGFYYIVCHDQSQVKEIAFRAKEMNLNIPLPITHHTFLEGSFHPRGVKGFVIDDFDSLVLRMIADRLRGRELVGITLEREWSEIFEIKGENNV
jgi:hypothetical protein